MRAAPNGPVAVVVVAAAVGRKFVTCSSLPLAPAPLGPHTFPFALLVSRLAIGAAAAAAATACCCCRQQPHVAQWARSDRSAHVAAAAKWRRP